MILSDALTKYTKVRRKDWPVNTYVFVGDLEKLKIHYGDSGNIKDYLLVYFEELTQDDWENYEKSNSNIEIIEHVAYCIFCNIWYQKTKDSFIVNRHGDIFKKYREKQLKITIELED